MPRPDDLQLFMRIEIGRTTTGARMAVSTGRVVDEAFAMAVDVEPASSGGSGLNRLLIFLVLALRPLCAHQAAPNSDAFAHSNDARHAFCLVRAMHWRPARSTHGKAKSTRYFCVYNPGGLYLLL